MRDTHRDALNDRDKHTMRQGHTIMLRESHTLRKDTEKMIVRNIHTLRERFTHTE